MRIRRTRRSGRREPSSRGRLDVAVAVDHEVIAVVADVANGSVGVLAGDVEAEAETNRRA